MSGVSQSRESDIRFQLDACQSTLDLLKLPCHFLAFSGCPLMPFVQDERALALQLTFVHIPNPNCSPDP